MKKLVAFIWLIIYTCVSTGFAVSTHYCMNEQRSVELGDVKQETCAKCGMQKKENNGCCRDEVKVIKLQQDTQPAKVLLPSFSISVPVCLVSPHLLTPFYNFINSSALASFEPPPLYTAPIYIENRVFRI